MEQELPDLFKQQRKGIRIRSRRARRDFKNFGVEAIERISAEMREALLTAIERISAGTREALSTAFETQTQILKDELIAAIDKKQSEVHGKRVVAAETEEMEEFEYKKPRREFSSHPRLPSHVVTKPSAPADAGADLYLYFQWANFDGKIYRKIPIEKQHVIKVVLRDYRSASTVQDHPHIKIGVDVVDDEGSAYGTARKYDISRPRPDKRHPLLSGDCDFLMSQGIATVEHIKFTDERSHGKKLRFVAFVLKEGPYLQGIHIKPAVSDEAFVVQTERSYANKRGPCTNKGRKQTSASATNTNAHLGFLVQQQQRPTGCDLTIGGSLYQGGNKNTPLPAQQDSQLQLATGSHMDQGENTNALLASQLALSLGSPTDPGGDFLHGRPFQQQVIPLNPGQTCGNYSYQGCNTSDLLGCLGQQPLQRQECQPKHSPTIQSHTDKGVGEGRDTTKSLGFFAVQHQESQPISSENFQSQPDQARGNFLHGVSFEHQEFQLHLGQTSGTHTHQGGGMNAAPPVQQEVCQPNNGGTFLSHTNQGAGANGLLGLQSQQQERQATLGHHTQQGGNFLQQLPFPHQADQHNLLNPGPACGNYTYQGEPGREMMYVDWEKHVITDLADTNEQSQLNQH